ncbi:aspartate dehydrogenase [candidate division FCPU426 bacterium]|nr:aspartate dehydrogenase [candidate division FCPU426 bacterium]
MQKRLKIGIIGCGAIGGQLAKALSQKRPAGVRLAALTDVEADRARRLARRMRPRPAVVSLAGAVKTCDLLVEAAGAQALPDVIAAVLRARKQLLCLSVGAFIKHPEWLELFCRRGVGLHFPSGAITGLDSLKAASAAGLIHRVRLETRKPPAGLAGAPFFRRSKMDPMNLKKPLRIFSGSARQAIRLFPANVNVAAAVALLGIGPDRTRVDIVADPKTRRNTHTLEVTGSFGRFVTVTENVPSAENPKTSMLAAASALAVLLAIGQGNHRGT